MSTEYGEKRQIRVPAQLDGLDTLQRSDLRYLPYECKWGEWRLWISAFLCQETGFSFFARWKADILPALRVIAQSLHQEGRGRSRTQDLSSALKWMKPADDVHILRDSGGVIQTVIVYKGTSRPTHDANGGRQPAHSFSVFGRWDIPLLAQLIAYWSVPPHRDERFSPRMDVLAARPEDDEFSELRDCELVGDDTVVYRQL